MAANQFDVNYRQVAQPGGSAAKTNVGLKAAANVALKILEASATFDGATSTAAPAIVDFNRATFATNAPGTNSSSATPSKRDPGRAETFQFTAATAWTTEPTVLTAQHTKDVAQYMGIYHYIHPFASPLIVVGGQGFCITITVGTGTPNASGHISGEE